MATMYRTKCAEPMGAYKPTAVDAAKAAAKVRIIAISGRGVYTVALARGVPFPDGPGVTRLAGGFVMTERAYEAFAKGFAPGDIVTDF